MSQPTITVEIDDAIHRDLELLRDVEAVNAHQNALHEWTEPPQTVRWVVAIEQPDRAGHRIGIGLGAILSLVGGIAVQLVNWSLPQK